MAAGVFFSGKGHGKMNQFVPQLMLGNSLTTSSGPPDYKPKWVEHTSWVFSSQYFMEVNNTKTGNAAEGHAATGVAYPAKVGEKLALTGFMLEFSSEERSGERRLPVAHTCGAQLVLPLGCTDAADMRARLCEAVDGAGNHFGFA